MTTPPSPSHGFPGSTPLPSRPSSSPFLPNAFLVTRAPSRFLDAQGLYVPGLFRVAGNTETIRQLKAMFDAGEQVEFDERVRWWRVLACSFFFLSFPTTRKLSKIETGS